MAIKTTINILKTLDCRMNTVCEKTGVTKNYLIMQLLKKIIKAHRKKKDDELIIIAKGVKYQPRQPDKTNWKKLHVLFLNGDYEYALDLKKLNKMSVSYLLAEAIRKYLTKIERCILKDSQNMYYCPYEYMIEYDVVEEISCWKMYWGMPLSSLMKT